MSTAEILEELAQLSPAERQVIVAMISGRMSRAGHPSRVVITVASPAGRQSGLLADSVVMVDNVATVAVAAIDRVIFSITARWRMLRIASAITGSSTASVSVDRRAPTPTGGTTVRSGTVARLREQGRGLSCLQPLHCLISSKFCGIWATSRQPAKVSLPFSRTIGSFRSCRVHSSH